MNPRIDQLLRTLLQKDSIDDCSLELLQDYAGRHPYFGAAQLLLAKKMQRIGDPGYEEQYQRTLLYFNNPLWVEHLLNEKGRAVVENEAEVKAEAEIEREAEVKAEVETEKKTEIKIEDKVIETPQPQPESDSPLPLFEPFHTVDYFASQGIKVNVEEKPKDKFGQQLMSFTQWLKTLKKLPVSEIAAEIPQASEKKVEEMAETSIQDRYVVTEAMAEVWEKQGNHRKAIDIYRKLSLLEPAKSAYFAAKIDAIKD